MTEVLPAPIHGASHFGSYPLRSSSHHNIGSLNTSIPYPNRSDTKHSYTHTDYEINYQTSTPSSAPSSPQLTHSAFSWRPSYSSTPASSLSLDARTDLEQDEILFPSYERSGSNENNQELEKAEEHEQIAEDEAPERPQSNVKDDD